MKNKKAFSTLLILPLSIFVFFCFSSTSQAALTFSASGITGDSAFNTLTIPGIVAGFTQCLHINSSGVISVTGSDCGVTSTNLAGGLGGQIPYQSAAGTTAMLGNGTAGQVLTSAGTTLAPTWTTPSGSGTVTHTAGALTATAIATGNGGADIKTPSATATLDSSGNLSTPGSVATGAGGSNAGAIQLGQGTAPSLGTTAVTMYAPTSVTSYGMILPSTSATGFLLGTNSSNINTLSFVGSSGTGSVCLTTNCSLTTPALGTPSALVGTNISGTATSLTSGITNALKSATTTVDVSAATAPTNGQVLTATGGTTATWQTPSGAGLSGLTTNKIPKATSGTTIADSSISDDGTTIKTGENLDVQTNTTAFEIANCASSCGHGGTGTTLNKVAVLTAANPSTVTLAATSDTTGASGIVVGGAGTTSNAVIARDGQASCVFDGATTAGHYVQMSASVAGDCTDAGASVPSTGQILGRVLSTNGGAGTYAMTIAPPHYGGGASGGTLADPGGNGVVVRTSLNTTTNRTITAGTGMTVTNGDGTAGNPTIGITANGVTSTQLAAVNTRHVCDIGVGDTSGSAITDAQLGPQKRMCFIPAAATLIEVDVSADAGTPNVILGRNVAGTQTNVLSAALATASAGGIACSNTGGTTGIDGATTCSATLQNTALAAGSYLELVSGTAGGTAKLMTIHAIYTIN